MYTYTIMYNIDSIAFKRTSTWHFATETVQICTTSRGESSCEVAGSLGRTNYETETDHAKTSETMRNIYNHAYNLNQLERQVYNAG